MKDNLISKALIFGLRWSWVGAIILTATAIIFAPYINRIELKLSLSDLLPERNINVMELDELTDMVGGVGYLVVVIRAGYKENAVARARALTEQIADSDLVKYVFYEREERFIADRALYQKTPEELNTLYRRARRAMGPTGRDSPFLDIVDRDDPARTEEEGLDPYFADLKEEIGREAIEFRPYYTSPDESTIMVMIKPAFSSNELDLSGQLIALTDDMMRDIRDMPDEDGVGLSAFTWRLGGKYYDVWKDTGNIRSDLKRVSPLAFAAIAIFLFLFFSNLQAVIVLLAPLALAIVLTLEAIGFVLGHVNVITGFLVVILSGLGVDYGIHIVKSMSDGMARRGSQSLSEVFQLSYRTVGRAVFSCYITTALAFAVLIISDFKGFYEFGIIAVIGLTFIFLSYTLCVPVLLKLFAKRPVFRRIVPPLKYPVFRALWVYPVLGVLLALVVVGVYRTSFEYDFKKMTGMTQEILNLHDEMDDIFGKALTPAIIWAPDDAAEARVREALEAHPEAVERIIGLDQVVPPDQARKARIIGRIQRFADDVHDADIEANTGMPAEHIRALLAAEPYTIADLPVSLKEALASNSRGGRMMFVYPGVPLNEISGIHAMADALTDARAAAPGVMAGSETLVFSDILNHIWKDGRLALLFLFVGIFLVQLFDTRSFRRALALMAPLFIGFVVGMGVLGWMGVKFTIINVCIVPAIFGAGVDMAIHFSHRLWRGAGWDPIAAAREIFEPIFLAIFTTMIGFGVLVLCQAQHLKSVGIVAIAGLASLFFVTVMWLPGFMAWWCGRRFPKHGAGAESRARVQ